VAFQTFFQLEFQMSIDPRQPNEKQEVNRPASQNPAEHPNLPVPHEARPANREELSDETRQRLEQLAERAHAAHDLAKDAALRFCRHSIEAGMALLEAHNLCPKEIWSTWLVEHFDWSTRTVQRYMRQAKIVLLIGVKTTDLSFLPPEELSRLLEQGLKRIERQHAAVLRRSESAAPSAPVREIREESIAINVSPSRPSTEGDWLAKASALFDELLTVVRRAMESGQGLDYGQFVLDELERIRGDLDVCRLLIRDAHLAASVSI
jgi:hypothetical protein